MLYVDAVTAVEDIVTEAGECDGFCGDVATVVGCLCAGVTLTQGAHVRSQGKQVEAGVLRQQCV